MGTFPARLFLVTLALALPTAGAQTTAQMTVALVGEHPVDHVMEVPADSLRTRMDFVVAVEASGFACPTDSVVSVEGVLTYPDEWAGASLNPKATTVRIPAGQPLAGMGRFEAEEPVTLEIAWGENRPDVGARVTYDIVTQTKLDGCAPAPAVEEEHARVNATMPDTAATPEPELPCENAKCACDEDASACEEIETNPTPSLGLGALLAAAFVALGRRRL